MAGQSLARVYLKCTYKAYISAREDGSVDFLSCGRVIGHHVVFNGDRCLVWDTKDRIR